MSLNRNSLRIVERMRDKDELLRIEVLELDNGTSVLDCGVNAEGSLGAGRLYSQACMGGLGKVSISTKKYGKNRLNTVEVTTDKPALACLGSQKAGWSVKTGDFFAMGSGPARMLLEKARPSEDSSIGVLALECSVLPDEVVASFIAAKCDLREENLTLLCARTSSLVGSTQVSARMVETALYKMDHLGMDTASVRSGKGTAPIAPVCGNDNKMMGVENDMIIYGSEVYLETNGDVDVEAIPSATSSDYGLPFMEAFKKAGYDFYKIDQGIFAPAKIKVKNIQTGISKEAGSINLDILERTLSA